MANNKEQDNFYQVEYVYDIDVPYYELSDSESDYRRRIKEGMVYDIEIIPGVVLQYVARLRSCTNHINNILKNEVTFVPVGGEGIKIDAVDVGKIRESKKSFCFCKSNLNPEELVRGIRSEKRSS
ncbi:hypothetical protein ACFL08_00640 [Patescibacteria group bacterium]